MTISLIRKEVLSKLKNKRIRLLHQFSWQWVYWLFLNIGVGSFSLECVFLFLRK